MAVNQVNGYGGVYNAVTLGEAGEFSDATSAEFNGSSSSVATTHTVLDTAESFSVSAWAKLSTLSSYPDVVTEDGTDDSAFELQYDTATGTWALSRSEDDTDSPTIVKATGGPAVAAGTWYLLTGTYDASSGLMSLYVNGTLAGTATDSTPFAASGDLLIGRGLYEGVDGGYFGGEISDVAAYQSTLSSQEVSNLYASATNAQGLSAVLSETVTDSQGDATTYKYDPDNGYRLIAETGPRGYTTTYGYDTSGFLYTVTDPNGNVTTTQHDVRGNLVAKTTCQDTATQACSTQYRTYYPDDTSAQLTTASPENDLPLTYSTGDSASSTDTTYQTRYAYDNLGDEISVTRPPVTTETYSDGTYTASSSEAGLTTTARYAARCSAARRSTRSPMARARRMY